MRLVAASLAAVLLGLAAAGCGGDGAEPDAPEGATLILDFQPNAVHAGIYAGKARGYFEDEGVDLTIREPSSTSDATKLLEAGRADFAVMDINDFGIARERGANLAAIAAIVQRPLASVIARDRNDVRAPADLAGKTVGVTGVPSDDAVLDTVLASGGLAPDSVERIDIGFNAIQALAAGRIGAATAFWNAEGVELERLGIPTREFRVDEFGAPRYPELVLVVPADAAIDALAGPGAPVCRVLGALDRGYADLGDDPNAAVDDLVAGAPATDPTAQRAQLAALDAADAFSSREEDPPTTVLDPGAIRAWARWARARGVVDGEDGAAARGFAPNAPEDCTGAGVSGAD